VWCRRVSALTNFPSRGKKIFRRFADADDGDVEDEEADEATVSDQEIKRQAGEAANTQLKRSAVKPRILWPTKEQIAAKEAAEAQEAAEEALTDIELPPSPGAIAKPSTAESSITLAEFNQSNNHTTEASKVPSAIEPQQGTEGNNGITPVAEPSDEVAPVPTNKLLQKAKRGKGASPFDRWSRIKHGTGASPTKLSAAGAKREGSPLEKQTKRVRSGAGPVDSTS
jgi:hypothetical protein